MELVFAILFGMAFILFLCYLVQRNWHRTAKRAAAQRCKRQGVKQLAKDIAANVENLSTTASKAVALLRYKQQTETREAAKCVLDAMRASGKPESVRLANEINLFR